MKDFLFAYGTLLPACTPVHLREAVVQLKPVYRGSMPGRLYDLGDYPGAVFDAAATTRVYGEVFELPCDGQFLSRLDDYEGFSPADPTQSLFIRDLRPITLTGDSLLPCWVYLYNRDLGNSPLISGGDYFIWVTTQHASDS